MNKTSHLKYNLFAIILSCCMLFACQKPKEVEFKEIKNFTLGKPESGYIKSNVEIVMFNPNNVSVDLTESYFELYLNGKHVGNSVQKNKIPVPKLSDFSIPVQVNIEAKKLDILNNALQILTGKKMLLKMVGYCKIKKMGISMKIPISHEQEQALF